MTELAKKRAIKKLVKEMFKRSAGELETKIERALKSGAIDIDSWEPDVNPMLVPKAILIAFLRDEANQYTCNGTSFEKQVRNDAKNIGYNL